MSLRPPPDPGACSSDEQAQRARARREADFAAVELLAAAGFQGSAYELFANRLISRGRRTIDVWTLRRTIFRECAKREIHLEPQDWSEDERLDLVQDTVATGYRRFHAGALCRREWTPQGGASLSTFFIGTCVYAFSDEYRAWQRAKIVRQMQLRDVVAQMGTLPPAQTQRVGAAVIDRACAREALGRIAAQDPRLARILALYAEGHPYEQIAALLGDGTTPRAVEAVLYRHRQHLTGNGPPR